MIVLIDGVHCSLYFALILLIYSNLAYYYPARADDINLTPYYCCPVPLYGDPSKGPLCPRDHDDPSWGSSASRSAFVAPRSGLGSAYNTAWLPPRLVSRRESVSMEDMRCGAPETGWELSASKWTGVWLPPSSVFGALPPGEPLLPAPARTEWKEEPEPAAL